MQFQAVHDNIWWKIAGGDRCQFVANNKESLRRTDIPNNNSIWGKM